MNINKFVDKEYETMSFKEIADSPFDAIQGVTKIEADLIKKAFYVNQLLKFQKWAKAIVTLAEAEE